MAKKNDGNASVLADAIAGIEKRFGQGKVMKLGDKPKKFDCISTGSFKLDMALGGGLPKGRIIEIYGAEASGKTGIALEAIAQVQKDGGKAVIIDAEHALNFKTAELVGVDLDSLFICQPDNGEEAFEVAKALVKTGEFDLIVFDSVSAMQPKAVIDGEAGESKMGLHARLMGTELVKFVSLLTNSSCTAIFINQLREKIGVMFGSPETTQGGNALKFYASVRLDVRKLKADKFEQDEAYKRKVKVVKNKLYPPFKVAETIISFTDGVDIIEEMIDIAVIAGIIQKSGSWYSYDETKLGQGTNGVKSILDDNPELLDEIFEKVKSFTENN